MEDGITEQTDDPQPNLPDEGKTPTLSKRQMKREQKKENWLKKLPEKRQQEREKKKQRKRQLAEAGIVSTSRKKLKCNKMCDSKCKVNVVIDCSFDEYMGEKDINRLVSQIQYSYSANRRAENPVQLYATSVSSKTKTRLESVGDYRGWDVYFKDESYSEVFGLENVVYLSSDSPNVLTELEEGKAYVIGGLVDHNRQKGLCHRLAEERGIYHAQLPISQYIQLKTRNVLTVNQVFEILLHMTEKNNWEEAFYTAIPKRKGLSSVAEKESKEEQYEENPGENSCDDGLHDKSNDKAGVALGQSDRSECDNPALCSSERESTDEKCNDKDLQAEKQSQLNKSEHSQCGATTECGEPKNDKLSDLT